MTTNFKELTNDILVTISRKDYENAMRDLEFYQKNARVFWAAFEKYGLKAGTYPAVDMLTKLADALGAQKVAEIVNEINIKGQPEKADPTPTA